MRKLDFLKSSILFLLLSVFYSSNLFGQKVIYSDNFESTAYSETTGGGFPSNFSCTGQSVMSTLSAGVNDNPYNGGVAAYWRTMYSSGTNNALKTFTVQSFAENRTSGTGSQCLKVSIPDASFEDGTTKIRLNTESGKISFVGGSNSGSEGTGRYSVKVWMRTDGADKAVIKTKTGTQIITSSWAEYTLDNFVTGTGAVNLSIEFVDVNSDYVVYFDDFQLIDNFQINTAVTQLAYNGSAADGVNYFSDLRILNGGTLTINAASLKTLNSITIDNGGSLIISANATQRIINIRPGGYIENNGSIELKSNISLPGKLYLKSDVNGTATLKGSGSIIGSVDVEQYLPSVRNWYVSSPVASATSTVTDMSKYFEYIEAGTNDPTGQPTGSTVYWKGYVPGHSMEVGKGYVALPNTAGVKLTFTGTLNNGNVPASVSSTGATTQSGYNLVGNPYPSYINWDNATLTNVKTTIWQRSNSGSAYVFDTYNSSGNVAVDLSGNRTNGNIAPMQAFWVQVADGQTGGTVLFTNSMRAHKGSKAITGGTVNDPIFKVGASATVQPAMMRLQVSNGINTDETVLYQNENAQNSVDRYDSPKMSNSNAEVPEIYSLVNGNKLTINGVNSIDANTELPLGFVTGQANSFSLKVSQLSNMNPELQLVLKDKVTGAQQVMTEGSVYNFTSDATSASDRFSVLFRSSSATTGVNDIAAKNKFGVYVNDAGSIVVDLFDASATGTAAVYNIAGSRVDGQLLKASKSVLETKTASGIYMVKVSNGTLTETHRVIIK